jgi:hypothetical protein
MLEPNIQNLKKIFDGYKAPRKNFMDMSDVNDVFTQKTDLLVQEKDVVYCAGMSKMTFSWETKKQDEYYNSFRFVEFLEMIGRVAHFKFPGSDNETMSLCQKMELVLDDILAIKDIKRIEGEITIVDESESDRDY